MAKTIAILLGKSAVLSPFDRAMIVSEAIGELRRLKSIMGSEGVEQLEGYKSLNEFIEQMREDAAVDRLVTRVNMMRGVPEGENGGTHTR